MASIIWQDDEIAEIKCNCGDLMMVNVEDWKRCGFCGRRHRLMQYVETEEPGEPKQPLWEGSLPFASLRMDCDKCRWTYEWPVMGMATEQAVAEHANDTCEKCGGALKIFTQSNA